MIVPSAGIKSSLANRLSPLNKSEADQLHPIRLLIYRLARRGRNERVNTARGADLANGLAGPASVFTPPKPGSSVRLITFPVKRSIARIDNSSTGATRVIARPEFPARPEIGRAHV